MASLNQSPSGFSYAQAARGHKSSASSQAHSSKVTSGTATPATGTFSELGPTSNWADDVEATTGAGSADSKTPPEERNKVKENAVERTKSESRPQIASSGVSSPDLATTPSTAANTDEASSAANGTSSSETTWETKSQSSEPSWIAERKERQSSTHNDEQLKGKRGKKEAKEVEESKEGDEPALTQPPPKPVVLLDAPPPAVNPWAKRMETVKVKTSVAAAVPPAAKTVPSSQAVQIENQRPRADSRKKASSVTSIPREAESRIGGAGQKTVYPQGKRATDARTDTHKSSKLVADETFPGKAVQREHQSLPNMTTIPPPVRDEVSWPTPESAQEMERKEQSPDTEAKEVEGGGDGEFAAASKTHQKTKWKPIAVTPTIVWETEEMNRPPRGPNGERGGRGGNSARGRGGFRGAPAGSKGGDRAAVKTTALSNEGENGTAASQRDRSGTAGREAMPPPPKPIRQSSASGSRERRPSYEQSLTDRGPSAKRSAVGSSNGISTTAPNGLAVADVRRTRSPSELESVSLNSQQEVKMSEPVHRQGTTNVVQKDGGREAGDAVRDNPSVRRVPSDGKKDSRSFEGHNGKEWNGAPRGGKRSGRGRGGSREYTNGHQASQVFTNGHTDAASTAYGVPSSPSAYQTSRGQLAYPQGRGGWSRGNPRSQSIPVENGYGGRPFWPPQLHSLQTYYPGMYDYSGMPMSAVPYPPVVEHQYLMDMVSTQLEYYFSIDNLLKDMFLRKNMDSKGFVFLDVIANFNRIKQLTNDKDMLRAVCLRSDTIEIRIGEDNKERLRRREGWERFLLPTDQRETSAQNDGPTVLQRPEPPQVQSWQGQQSVPPGPASAGLPSSQRKPYDSGHLLNGAVPQFASFSPLVEPSYADLPVGEETRGRAAKSPIREASPSRSQAAMLDFVDSQDIDPDVFPNEHQDTLTVVVKMNPQRPHHHAASRTFSNGSIDTRSIISEIDKPAEYHAPPTSNGDSTTNGDIPRHGSPHVGRSPDKNQPSSEIVLLWVKDKEVPQESLPQDATLESYLALRGKAVKQRREAATGTCPYDLDVLYQFWSHFLIRNFNRNMYGEFKFYAHDDAQKRNNGVGLQNLVQFYAKALASSNPIRDSIVRDYVELVRSEPTILQGLAFKQLRQAWRNGALNLKNRKKLSDIVDESLKISLES